MPPLSGCPHSSALKHHKVNKPVLPGSAMTLLSRRLGRHVDLEVEAFEEYGLQFESSIIYVLRASSACKLKNATKDVILQIDATR